MVGRKGIAMKKKILGLIVCTVMLGLFGLLAGAGTVYADVAINEENFPDAIFRAYVGDNFDTDKDGQLSDTELNVVSMINVEKKGIGNLKGIEYFKQLEWLDCRENKLESLEISGLDKMWSISCESNQLTELRLENLVSLQQIICDGNKLENLDVSNLSSLERIVCSENGLKNLNLGYLSKLNHLDCKKNKLSELNVKHLTGLVWVFCQENEITDLDLKNLTELQWLYCEQNQLKSLDLSGNTALPGPQLKHSPQNLKEIVLTEEKDADHYVISLEKAFPGIKLENVKGIAAASGYTYDASKQEIIIEKTVGDKGKQAYKYEVPFHSDPKPVMDVEFEWEAGLKVSFNENGHGTAPAPQTVKKGDKATKPSDLSESGYIFKDWYTEAECINAFDFNTVITNDIILYAKWEKKISGGGSGSGSGGGSGSGSGGGSGGSRSSGGGPGNSSGAWVQDSTGWWYKYSNGSWPANAWKLINSKWYFFKPDGYMASGWLMNNGRWYYLGEVNDGSMTVGWVEVGGRWYYLGGADDGSMKTGWVEIGGKWYYLYDDGHMAANENVGGYNLGADGAWVK